MLSEGYKTFLYLPYLLWIPAVTLSVIMIGFNLLADGLRDAFDPKMKSEDDDENFRSERLEISFDTYAGKVTSDSRCQFSFE